MKIRIDDIPPEGLEIDFDGSENLLGNWLESIKLSDLDVNPNGRGHIRIDRNDEEIMISGDVEISAVMLCSRCLVRFDSSIPVSVDMKVKQGAKVDKDYEQQLELGEDEILILNKEIDLSELIAQELSLSIPMKPLCKNDCPGLCPECGSIIGSEGCSCSHESSSDPRWEKLAALKSRFNN
ncbi:MAG: hypothetical protein QG663_1158 [Thermodesulfobacteriota bacterium]|nr:hypothetical protein [Thermodesulfobacteriota bacterium]